MAQDYAKQRQAPPVRRRPARSSATRALPDDKRTHWSWFFSGLMSGVILAIAGYLGVLKLESDAAEAVLASQGGEGQAELPAFNFGFYRDLANAEVAVDVAPAPLPAAPAPDTTTPASEAVTVTSPTVATAEAGPNYLLQAGSFQNRQDAENQRARLMLLNMEARIMQGVVSGRTVYRVHAGPYAGKRNLDQARALLSENNIESMPLLVR